MIIKHYHPRGGPSRYALGLTALAALLALPLSQVEAAAVLQASANVKPDLGKVNVKGNTSKKLKPGSWVSIYDAEHDILLYTAKTDGNRSFDVDLQNGGIPCQLRLESGETKLNLKVKGADNACQAAPVCSIAKPAKDAKIFEGQSLEFKSALAKGGSDKGLSYWWTLGDGSPDMSSAKFNHTFQYAGQYRITLQVNNKAGNRCSDDVVVMVAPPAGSNPNPKVSERPKPSTAEALKSPTGSWIVLPFEETGMQGGSMINLPFNPMIPYNNLNSQVIQKVKGKPVFGNPDRFELFYSAASNPKDPVGGDSINSTSQNLFPDGEAGSNYDPLATLFDPVSQAPTDVKFIDGHDFRQAAIKKNELWDRMHQPYAKELKIPETGNSIANTQTRYTPPKTPAQPDQSIRGSADDGAGLRQMPGFAAPYQANDPQPLDGFNATKQQFKAQFIPSSGVDDQGRVNPYPLMRVEARDKSGKLVAKTDAVYTSTSETRCRECHAKGKIAGDESVWRTPVAESELFNADGTPGPATGAGSYSPGADPTKPWPPAVHNRFDDKHPENPTFTNLNPGVNDPTSPSYVPRDANGLRTDRVAESRIGPDGKLQIRLKFAEPESGSWVDQEKAALFNTLVMHDYMVLYGPTPAEGKLWPASYSTQLADSYADDKGKSRAQPMYFCAGHHFSNLQTDNGVAPRRFKGNRSDYSAAYHAFHGKLQVYKKDVTAKESADGLPHKKGDLIRDDRGHPKMFGGRGWDSQHNDNFGVPVNPETGATTAFTYDPAKNDWRPDLFPADPNGEPLLPFGEGVAMEENCTKCHTGPTEKSYRDIHHSAGLKCDNCHGDMLAVGNAYPNPKFDANLTGGSGQVGETIHFRRPWLDQPDCGSCHVGDGNRKESKDGFFSAGVKKTAYAANDPAAASLFPENARFAVMPIVEPRKQVTTVDGVTVYQENPVSQALFRKSKDVHGSGADGELACAACHGGSHALWPNTDPNANDNVTAKQLQGYDGNIAECSVCHVKDDFKGGMIATNGGVSNLGVAQGVRDGSVVNATSKRAYLAGPHGMHPVNDPYWWKQAELSASNQDKTRKGGWHNDFAKKPGPDGEDQCAACHGSDHLGTRLSKAFTDRSFVDENGKPVNVAANTPIGCNLCHSLEKSFTGVPTGKPVAHPPPAPEAVHAAAGGGDGGHGGH
jgi:hypothetical protein